MGIDRLRASRREFLRSSAALGLAVLGPRPARIRGRVTENDRGIPGVVVSDGLSTTATDGLGDFEIVSDRKAKFVFVRLPSGYRIPTGAEGLARIHRPLAFDARGEAAAAFALQREESSPAHRFLVFGDTQIRDQDEARELRKAMADVETSAAFGITCGDLVHDAMELFPSYASAVASTGVPFFQVLGNHDLDPGPGSLRTRRSFERWFGPTYYSFDVGEIHHIVLDDVFWLGDGYVGFLGEEQLSWLASDLSRVEAGRMVAIFAHVPFLSTISERIEGKIAKREAEVSNRDRLYELLAPFEAHLVSAHTHENEHCFHGGLREHVVSTVCGAWWSGPVCWDGTPNGYHLYEARAGRLSWQFRPTGLGTRQLRVYGPGADPRHPDEILANVWNWDPDWKVFWYEDGVRRGEMRRARGLDPLAVSLYQGTNRPLKNPEWVEPVSTDHLFHAPSGAGSVRVEVVDPFGRTDSAEAGEAPSP